MPDARTTTVALLPHPASSPGLAGQFDVVVQRPAACELLLHYRFDGEPSQLMLPPRSQSVRRDGLWRETCFEAFVAADVARDSAAAREYVELNFSPSGAWAAYAFDDCRIGMRELPMPLPRITVERHRHGLELTVQVDLTAAACAARDWRCALTAVLVDASGRTSYWSAKHPAGPPDFHHPDNFIVNIARPTAERTP